MGLVNISSISLVVCRTDTCAGWLIAAGCPLDSLHAFVSICSWEVVVRPVERVYDSLAAGRMPDKTLVAAPIMEDTSLKLAGTMSVLPSLAKLPNRSK